MGTLTTAGLTLITKQRRNVRDVNSIVGREGEVIEEELTAAEVETVLVEHHFQIPKALTRTGRSQPGLPTENCGELRKLARQSEGTNAGMKKIPCVLKLGRRRRVYCLF